MGRLVLRVGGRHDSRAVPDQRLRGERWLRGFQQAGLQYKGCLQSERVLVSCTVAETCCSAAHSSIDCLPTTAVPQYIRHFTRLSGELFGMLIALLFLQQAIKGSIEEFRSSSSGAVWVGGSSSGSSSGGSSSGGGSSGGSGELFPPPPDAATWQLVNGVWSLLLAFGLLLASLLMRSARGWRFLRPPLR